MAIFYLLFNVVEINYRPILIDGKLEASFPSSHIFVVEVLTLSTTYVVTKLFKNPNVKTIGYGASILLTAVTFLGRIFSMNHWFTDCLAAVLLGLGIFFLFIYADSLVDEKLNKAGKEA